MYSEFTSTQRNDIVNGAISNNQVHWIVEDPDVNQFLRSVIEGHEDEIEYEALNALQGLLEKAEGEPYFPEDVPF